MRYKQKCMPCVYILQSEKDGRFYIGSTTDLKRRLKYHSSGQTPSTKRLGPCVLVFTQEYPTLKEAREIERRLKSLKRKDYIQRIIEDGEIRMKPCSGL